MSHLNYAEGLTYSSAVHRIHLSLCRATCRPAGLLGGAGHVAPLQSPSKPLPFCWSETQRPQHSQWWPKRRAWPQWWPKRRAYSALVFFLAFNHHLTYHIFILYLSPQLECKLRDRRDLVCHVHCAKTVTSQCLSHSRFSNIWWNEWRKGWKIKQSSKFELQTSKQQPPLRITQTWGTWVA